MKEVIAIITFHYFSAACLSMRAAEWSVQKLQSHFTKTQGAKRQTIRED